MLKSGSLVGKCKHPGELAQRIPPLNDRWEKNTAFCDYEGDPKQ